MEIFCKVLHNLLCHTFLMRIIDTGVSTSNVINQLIYGFSCALLSSGAVRKFGEQEARVPLTYCLEQLLRFIHSHQTSRVHHNLKGQCHGVFSAIFNKVGLKPWPRTITHEYKKCT